jgi:hybrid cluster-associated redox disulfide protein
MAITKDMSIIDVLRTYPETREVFVRYGLGCIVCMGVVYASIEVGARMHRIDIDSLIKDLNAVANKVEQLE